jgi:hypothetical protein
MANNVILNPGTGGKTVASKDVGGAQHQRVQPTFGVAGVGTDVSTADPLPVALYSAAAIGLVADSSGHLITGDFSIEVIEGNVPGHTWLRKFGHNIDVGLSMETVWSTGGLYVWPTTTETLSIVSTDTDDDGDPVGNGARTIFILGLDGSYTEVSETITMNGTTPVITANSYFRVFRSYVVAVGTSLTNEGTITITNSTAGQTLATIEAGEGQTDLGLYTIPAAKTGYLMEVIPTVTRKKGEAAEFNFFIREENQAFRDRGTYNSSGGGPTTAIPLTAPLVLPAKTDVEVRAIATAANTRCAIEFTILLVDN